MKSVLISIQPYWVFLIIAKAMGWDIGEEKTVEVRKSYPKNENWDKIAKIYCSKDKKSFAKIPKEYQPLMQRFLGKVIGEFVCDCIQSCCDYEIVSGCSETEWEQIPRTTQLSRTDLLRYSGDGLIYFWHISDLVIYDKPKELSEFLTFDNEAVKKCEHREQTYHSFTDTGYIKNGMYCRAKDDWCTKCKTKPLKRPPQSWCYVEEVQP